MFNGNCRWISFNVRGYILECYGEVLCNINKGIYCEIWSRITVINITSIKSPSRFSLKKNLGQKVQPRMVSPNLSGLSPKIPTKHSLLNRNLRGIFT